MTRIVFVARAFVGYEDVVPEVLLCTKDFQRVPVPMVGDKIIPLPGCKPVEVLSVLHDLPNNEVRVEVGPDVGARYRSVLSKDGAL